MILYLVFDDFVNDFILFLILVFAMDGFDLEEDDVLDDVQSASSTSRRSGMTYFLCLDLFVKKKK